VAVQAPSAANAQNWTWVAVADPQRRAAIAEVHRAGNEEYVERRLDSGTDGADRRRMASALHLIRHLHEVPVHVVVYALDPQLSRSEAIANRSVPVEAEIVGFAEPLRGGRPAVVRYRVEGRYLEGEVLLGGSGRRLGERVPLRYDPLSPERILEKGDEEPPGGEAPLWMPLSFMTAALSAVSAIRLRRRLRRSA
jgi:nitroreductase